MNQSHQSYDAWVRKILAIPTVLAKMLKVVVKKASGCSWLLSVTSHHQDLEFYISGIGWRATLSLPHGAVWTHAGGCGKPHHPAFVQERDAMGIVLEEENEVKLQLQACANGFQNIWQANLCHIAEDISMRTTAVRAIWWWRPYFHNGCHGSCFIVGQRMAWSPMCFLWQFFLQRRKG